MNTVFFHLDILQSKSDPPHFYTGLETRPIYHKRDETIRGHVFCSFLALSLKKRLEDCLRGRGEKWE